MSVNHSIERPAKSAAAGASLTGLVALALTAEHLSALAHQGFVAAEYRGQYGPFFKLRFRLQGQQVVRYLGKDRDIADQVQREVLALQAEHRLTKKMRRLVREARKALRQTKFDLQPLVEAAGLAFHGFAIRQPTGQTREARPDGQSRAIR